MRNGEAEQVGRSFVHQGALDTGMNRASSILVTSMGGLGRKSVVVTSHGFPGRRREACLAAPSFLPELRKHYTGPAMFAVSKGFESQFRHRKLSGIEAFMVLTLMILKLRALL